MADVASAETKTEVTENGQSPMNANRGNQSAEQKSHVKAESNDKNDAEDSKNTPPRRKFKEDSKERDSGDKERKHDRSERDERRSHKRSRSRSPRDRRRSRSRSPRDRRRSRSRSPRDHRRSSRDRRGDRDRDRRRRSRADDDYERRRAERERIRARDPTPPRTRRSPPPARGDLSQAQGLSRITIPFRPRHRPPRGVNMEMTQEERDQRTVFIMQLSHRTQPEDLEEFFSTVGTVRDVRVIIDSKTRRLKGIAFVEFWEEEAVPLAIGLNGQRLCGAPLKIQATFAERNRAWEEAAMPAVDRGVIGVGGMKLYISNLHPAVDEDMLKMIFEPFGSISKCEIVREGGQSKGAAFLSYRSIEDGRRALEQLNNFELAGRAMSITLVNDTSSQAVARQSEKIGYEEATNFSLGRADQLGLMARLAEGTGMQLPDQSRDMLLNKEASQYMPSGGAPVASSCFMLSNLFDPAQETDPNWADDIRLDVIEECNKAGGMVCHCMVDKSDPAGNVYVKCHSVSSAQMAVTALHGRMFAGRMITAAYMPLYRYQERFPDSKYANQPISA